MAHDDELREFLAARLDRLSATAYLLTGNHHDAEDLLQAALVKVTARWPRIHELRDPGHYVWRVLYNEHVSLWRRRRRRITAYAEEDLSAYASGRDEAAHVVRRLVIQQALARLTPKQRAVVVLRYFEDLTEEESARILGCTLGTIKSQTHRALAKLRQVAPELEHLWLDGAGVR
ncbi:MAG: SigE family RNA polymerase sigma factor [Hamadaea sp.]|uniref:SigE family RNA polymerase sigma factor n=1 Tax=Hamadaea sp. TaxID=2024425 RepID=UPI0017941730|nr:SigE family RNA polymerase sigma factor [Hamadaea sp.]NUR74455.1 SigE family RNA polymerase sigma factor [Hamadaea sp.]NUT18963.1 SigE family RNA polymerase sigma factor [Hamadaea sp.]